MNAHARHVRRDALHTRSGDPHYTRNLDDFFHIERYSVSVKFLGDCSIRARSLRVLDAGCGYGYGGYIVRTKLEKTSEVVSVDISRNAVKYAKEQYPGSAYVIADVEQLPFRQNVFDAVVSFEVIEHVDDPSLMLDEIVRVLRRSGRFIVSTPNYFDLGQRVRKILGLEVKIQWPFHKREFTYREFISKLVKHDFLILKVQGQYFALGRIRGPFWLAVGLSKTLGKHLPSIARVIIAVCTC